MGTNKEQILQQKSQLSPAKQKLLEKSLQGKFKSESESNLIPRRSSTVPPELSFSQQRLWFLQQLESSNSFYNEHGAIKLIGHLDIAALERSINQIVQRHEALRTTFEMAGDKPVQIIASNLTLTLPIADLRELAEAERQTEIQRLSIEQSQSPFDLVRGPLLRWMLLQISDREYVLLFSMHHIITDGWSLGIMIRELSAFYQEFTTGRPASLPELPIQYADFAVWQRQELPGKLESQLSYWKQQLNDAPPLLQLPTDRSRPPVQRYRGAKLSFELPKNLTQAMGAIAQKNEATLFMTLLAAFKILLYRYSGQEDIIVGSPIANRNRAEIEGLIGCFINTLVLRTDCSGNPTFAELLYRVRKMMIGAYTNQDIPLEKLVEELQVERDTKYNPMFQVSFNLQNTPTVKFELPELTITPFETATTKALFDLRLDMTETDFGLEGFWEYNTDLFESSTIERMSRHFQTLLEAIAANPQQRVWELPLLRKAERHQLLVEWNDTQIDYARDKCIHQIFEAQVAKTPDAIAVVFEDRQLTYNELNRRANQLAHYLTSLGVKPETLVGICVERSVEMVTALLGILKAGGAYVPLDPHFPPERLSYMLADSRVELLLTQSSLQTSLPKHQAKVICLDTDRNTIAQHSQNNLEVEVDSKNLAYVIYTSGSTGKPKGVQIPQRALINFLNSMHLTLGMTEEDVLLSVTTLSFDIAALEIFLPLITGSRLVLISRDVAMDGSQLSKKLSKSNATFMQATPATWRLLLAAGWQGGQSLKVLCGGEALDNSLAVDLLERGTEVWNLYGPTESTIWSAVYQLKSSTKTSAKGTIPIGRPIANTQIYLLDRNLKPVPIGVAGELYIGGDGLARGYLNRPELTKEKFIPNPIAPSLSPRLYKTGDKARYLSDGKIEYFGRIDHQVKIRGFRIELGEIEAVLNTHPQIQQTVVIAREDIRGNKSLVAYIVTPEESIPTNKLREFLSSKLAEYMVPNIFVQLDTLPLTPNGKVDRKVLPAPDEKIISQQKYVAPRNQREETTAEIFASILEMSNVGIYDNFFELGGHSLLATQVISRLREEFQIDLPLRSLFQRPTVAQLVEHITTTSQLIKQISRLPISGARRKKIEL